MLQHKYMCVRMLQVEEEEMLIAELKKIELRKKEREKKQQDLQKLISAAEQTAEARYSGWSTEPWVQCSHTLKL